MGRGRGGRALWVESANVTAGGDPSIKINSYSHQKWNFIITMWHCEVERDIFVLITKKYI